MNRLVRHVRSNAVAYLALFVALGGTSYAALSLPRNSVGGRQIRNHSIDPVKLNPKYIAGSFRAWASVNSKGKIVASSGGARIVASVLGDRITWHSVISARCAASVTVRNPNAPGNQTAAAFGDASIVPAGVKRFGALVTVYTWTAGDLVPARQPYVVVIACPLPAP